MPKVFEIDGYKFFFFSNEGNPLEPCHVHVRKGDCLAKIWIEPEVIISSSYGFNSKELRFIERQVRENEQIVRSKWNEYFNS